MARVLLRFTHGLGDAAQFTCVLKHLRAYRPDWIVDVVSGRGKHSAFRGLCRASYHEHEPRPSEGEYDQIVYVNWCENYNRYNDRPNSKITNALADEFGIPYDPKLGTYSIAVSPEARERVTRYLESIGCARGADGRYNAVIVHYEGNTTTDRKNLDHNTARVICRSANFAGHKAVILDWDRRSVLIDGVNIVTPGVHDHDIWGGFGSGDAESIAALVGASRLFVGIDSGPGKVASATDTPTLIVWTGHHPLQFHDPHALTTHVIPAHHESMPPLGGDREMIRYFQDRYRYITYTPNRLTLTLHTLVTQSLNGDGVGVDSDNDLVCYGPFWVRESNFDQDLVIVEDVYFGDSYRTSLYDLAEWDTVVDVGAHIGCFAMLVRNRNPNARIVCVEACPENHAALMRNVGSFATVISAAMTYSSEELALLNAVRPDCESTGGSVVVNRSELNDPAHPLRQHGYQYWDDLRPLAKVTLEDAMRAGGIDTITMLKLDCEGSEFDILRHTPSLDRIRFIFGEYHGSAAWNDLRAARFSDWHYGHMFSSHDRGVFHLVNPRFRKDVPPMDKPTQTSELADISHYYNDPERARAEIAAWDRSGPKHLATQLRRAVESCAPSRVIEIGCGIGRLVPTCRELGITYHGIDRNMIFLDEARRRYVGPDVFFEEGDIRRLSPAIGGDGVLVVATAFLKHFSLSEWDDILARLLTLAPSALLEIHLADSDLDDGTEFHHVAVTETRLARVLAASQRIELWREINHVGRSRLGQLVSEVTICIGSAPSRVPVQRAPMRIAVPAGIGDAAWVMTKVPALLKKYGAESALIYTCESFRAVDYLKLLPFVAGAQATTYGIMEYPPVLPDGSYNYAPSQPHWHNQFDWFLQANGHLERGLRLENWMPELATDWSAPLPRFHEIDIAFAEEIASVGPYVTLYTGPTDGNTIAGHNRGPRWTPQNWIDVVRGLTELDLVPIFVGVATESDYFDRYLADGLSALSKRCYATFFATWPIARTLAVCARATAHIGYQSGLGVLSTYFGVPSVMFWRRYGDPINSEGATFNENMATAWVPPHTLAARRFFGAIYTRHTPADVLSFVAQFRNEKRS